MSEQLLAAATGLVDATAGARDQLRTCLVALISRLWAATITDPFDPAQTTAFARSAATANTAAEQAATATAAAYIDTYLGVAGASSGRAAKILSVTDVRGTPAQDVYARPLAWARQKIWSGTPAEAALDAALDRATGIAGDSVMLAARRGEHLAMSAHQVQRWRRSINPEMSRTGTCGLCIAASTRTYTTSALRPIHRKCHCVSVPVVPTTDGVIDAAAASNTVDLAAIYAAAGSTAGAALKNTRWQIGDHGELGPVLRPDGAPWRGPIAAAQASVSRTTGGGITEVTRARLAATRVEAARVELVSLRRTLDGLEQRAATGEDVTGPLTYQRERVRLLEALTDLVT